MQRIVLLVLSAVVISVLGWLALTRDPGGAPALDPAGGGATEESSLNAGAEDVALSGVKDSEAESDGGQRVGAGEEAAGSPPAGKSGSFLTGSVVTTDGTSLTGEVRVFARWSLQRAVVRENKELEAIPLEATVTVGGDGTFEVPLPRFARSVRLVVQSDFYAMDLPHRIRGELTEPVELRVTRGGCLLVELVGPAAGHAEAVLSSSFELVAASMQSPAAVQLRSDPRGQSSISRTAFMGSDGQLRFGGLPAGAPWRVSLGARSFVDVVQDVPAVPPLTYATTQVSVSRGIAVKGRAIDSEGEPVPGAALRLTSWDAVGQRYILAREVTGASGEDGEFDLRGVLPGEATLRWEAEGYLSDSFAVGALVDGEERTGVDIVLSGGGTISGLVSWPDGEPASGASVVVTDEGRPLREGARVKTDSDGEFKVTGLNGASFMIDVTARRTRKGAQWRASAVCQSQEYVGMVLGRGEVISGRVLDHDGKPVKKFTVSASAGERAADVVRVRVSGDDGAYELAGLDAGEWEISAVAKGYGTEPARIVSLPNGGDPVDFTLPGLCVLGGIVTDRSGLPVAGARLSIGRRRTESDVEGAFRLDKLEPGEQLVKIVAHGHGKPQSPAIHLEAGEEKTDASIVLSRGSRILGRVHPARRNGTESAVNLRKAHSYGDGSTTIDAEGNFEFSGLEAGTYLVRLGGAGDGDWIENFAQGREVQVEVPVESDVEVVLGDPADYPVTVHGQVTRDGEPAVGMLMYVYRIKEDAHMPRHIGRTDEDGRYEAPLRQLGEHSFCVGEGQQRQARFTVDVTGAKRQEVDFELPTLTLRGSARLWTGAPATGGGLMLTHSDVASEDVMVGHTYFASLGKGGKFEFRGLHAGTYRLRTGNYTRASRSAGLVIVEDIEVPGDEKPEEINIRIPAGAVVDVTAQDGGGLPFGGCRVELLNGLGRLSILRDTRTTDSQGRMRFTGVGPGTWSAVVRGSAGQIVGRARLDVSEGDVTEVMVVCER